MLDTGNLDSAPPAPEPVADKAPAPDAPAADVTEASQATSSEATSQDISPSPPVHIGKPRRDLWYHVRKKVRKGSIRLQKGTMSLSRSFSGRSFGRNSSGNLIRSASSSEDMKVPDDELHLRSKSVSSSTSFDVDGELTPGLQSEPSTPGAASPMAAAMPAAAQAAAAEDDGGAEIVEIVVPAPIPEESTEETKAAEAPGLAGVVEAATQKVAETEKDPLQSGGWPTPAESAMARKVELLDEVDELVKSGALKHAYSEMNPKDLVGKEATHVPSVTVAKGMVRVKVSHEMTPEHYISMIWIQDAFGKPLAAQKFSDITEDSKLEPVLNVPIANVLATVADSAADITAYAVCNKHGIWASENVQVTAEEVVSGKAKAKLVATIFVALPVLFLLISAFLKPMMLLAGPQATTELPVVPAGADEWTFMDTRHGITTSSKKIEGSPLLGYRAEGVIDMHISKLMHVFLNTTDAVNWVHDLAYLGLEDPLPSQKQLCPRGTSCAVYFQHYHMPWPVGHREFVLFRSISVDKKGKKVSGVYHSVEDERFPEKEGVVRAQSDHTLWQFQALGEGKTEIVLEAVADPKGNIPSKAVNFLSKTWPKHTIENLVKRAGALDEASSQFVRW